jgi:hypothetical protein
VIGRRLQPVAGTFDGVPRLVLPFGGVVDLRWQPGDYCGPITGYTGDKPAVFYLLPNAQPGDRLHHVCSPPHTFRECPDGSLEIRNSILHRGYVSDREPNGEWHGFLDEGHVWREV